MEDGKQGVGWCVGAGRVGRNQVKRGKPFQFHFKSKGFELIYKTEIESQM